MEDVRKQFVWLIIYFILNVLLQENPSNYMVEMARVESVSLSSSTTSLLLLVYFEETHIFSLWFCGVHETVDKYVEPHYFDSVLYICSLNVPSDCVALSLFLPAIPCKQLRGGAIFGYICFHESGLEVMTFLLLSNYKCDIIISFGVPMLEMSDIPKISRNLSILQWAC